MKHGLIKNFNIEIPKKDQSILYSWGVILKKTRFQGLLGIKVLLKKDSEFEKP